MVILLIGTYDLPETGYMNYLRIVGKLFKIAALLGLLTFYCLNTCFCSVGSIHHSAFSKLTDPDTQGYTSESSTNFFCHISQPGVSANTVGNTNTLALKKPQRGFSACGETIEQLLGNTFCQYSFYSKNVLIRFRQSDIIFPSHYFW